MTLEELEDAVQMLNVAQTAETNVLLTLVDAALDHLGVKGKDGQSAIDRFPDLRREEIERLYRAMEIRDPATAARLHDKFEEIKRQTNF